MIVLHIEMPRGDIRPVTFRILDDGGPCEIDITEIYFTVKTSFAKPDYLFQKKLSSGDIELMEDGDYQLVIEPEDTDRLKYGRYVFDIQVESGIDLKQTFVGTFDLMDEATYAENEGKYGSVDIGA